MELRKFIATTIREYLNEKEEGLLDSGRIFYHGTNANIKISDLKQSGLPGDYGTGIYLTTEKHYAERSGKYLLSTRIKSPNHIVIGSSEYFKEIYPEIGMDVRMASDVAMKKGYTTLEVPRHGDDKWVIILDKKKIEFIDI